MKQSSWLVILACLLAQNSELAYGQITGAWSAKSKPQSQALVDTGSGTRVWDENPSLGRHFVWSGGVNADQQAHGEGTLEWRQANSADYGTNGLLSVYTGRMENGRRSGHGRLRLQSGEVYEGDWKEGLQHGSGRAWYPDGSYYEGEFRQGERYGNGLLISPNGERYEGLFRAGVRHGDGISTLPKGASYESNWNDGRETEGSKQARKTLLAQTSGAGDGVRINVALDTRQNERFRRANDDSGSEAITYRGRSTRAGLLVEPDFRMWEVWKRQGTLSGEGWEAGIGPVFLVVGLESRRPGRTVIERGYLEVEASETDRRPYITFTHWGNPDFSLQNVGWGPARNCVFEFELLAPGQRPSGRASFQKAVGTLHDELNVTLEPELVRTGVRMDFIKANMYDLPRIVNRGNARRIFGPFARFDSRGELVEASAQFVGRLHYEWSDGRGTQRSSVVLRGTIQLYNIAEYGAPGPVDESYDVALKLDQGNYRVPFSFRRGFDVGKSSRFLLRISAPKSSRHRFRVVVQSTDGGRWQSAPVNLHYFLPRFDRTKQ